MLFKILRPAEWAELLAEGRFDGSVDDRRDGFVHLSSAEQVDGTRARHFGDDAALWLLGVAVEADPWLRWEASRGGRLFPHLYRPLYLSDVRQARLIS